MKKKIAVILALMFLFISSSIFAETIVLKSGKTIEGKILEKTDKYIKVDTEGIPLTYYIDDIESIDGNKITHPSSTETANENKSSPTLQNQNISNKEKLNKTIASSDEMESKFKNITEQIARDLQTELSVKGLDEGKITAFDKEKIAAAESNIAECKSKLKSLIKANPKSIWADDAQYIIVALTFDNKQRALELEYLLKEYPNMHIEDWTKETLNTIMLTEKYPFEALIRMDLCADYLLLGDIEKLKLLSEESIKKYPDIKVFEKFLQKATDAKK